jgi:hypothetical protein
MLVSYADARILKRRRRAQQDRLAAEEAKAVRAAAVDRATRLISDKIGAYQACPSAKCRRRRCCVGGLLRCSPIIDAHGGYDIGRTVQQFYWDTLDRYADGRPIETHAGDGGLA